MVPLFVPAVLNDAGVRTALQQAWVDSQPGITGGHEEGGFILRDSGGGYQVVRWGKGTQDRIQVPPHPGCRPNGMEIIASFHTHPNTGSSYHQEPRFEDRWNVRFDMELKEPYYEGELVLSE